MSAALPPSAAWIADLTRQLRRGRHVLLHGNVQDLFLCDGQYLSLPDLMDLVLDREGYRNRAHYDVADGLVCGDERAATRLDLVNRSRPAAAAAREGAPAYRVPGAAATQPSVPARTTLRTPDVAIPAIRGALRDPDELWAVSLDWADKLLGQEDHLGLEERGLLVQLRKAASEATLHMSGAGRGRRNALVLVAAALGQVPAWLYRGNPLFHLVEVGRPEPDERRHFIAEFGPDFHGGRAPTAEQAAGFADITDGLTTWDLVGIRAASHQEALGLDRIEPLVHLYKYGQQRDFWAELDERKLREADVVLRRRVIGQEPAISAVTRMLTRAQTGISLDGGGRRGSRPQGVFFFVGPTGVGKTELAKALAELVFSGNPDAVARFDMSEYQQEHAAEKLTGSPPGYVGYGEGGQLTNRVRQRPFSLLLFDEVEKAHPRVLDRFLQILDDGRLTDGRGETVFFSQTVIVFTSNLGAIAEDPVTHEVRNLVEPSWSYDAIARQFTLAVEQHFRLKLGRPELLNRLGQNIVAFDVLRPHHVAAILEKFLSNLAASALDRRGVRLGFAPSVIERVSAWCLQGDNLLKGGRGIRSICEDQVLTAVAAYLRGANPAAGTSLRVEWPAGADPFVEVARHV